MNEYTYYSLYNTNNERKNIKLVYPIAREEGKPQKFRFYPGQNGFSLFKAGLTRKKHYLTVGVKAENQYDPDALDFKQDNEGLMNASLSM